MDRDHDYVKCTLVQCQKLQRLHYVPAQNTFYIHFSTPIRRFWAHWAAFCTLISEMISFIQISVWDFAKWNSILTFIRTKINIEKAPSNGSHNVVSPICLKTPDHASINVFVDPFKPSNDLIWLLPIVIEAAIVKPITTYYQNKIERNVNINDPHP